MISTPQFSQLPFETLILGGLGYTLGRLSKVNEEVSAAVLVIGSIANFILFKISDQWVRPQLEKLSPQFKVSSEAIYTGTNAITATAAAFAAQHFELISRRMTGITVFAILGVFAARLKILANS